MGHEPSKLQAAEGGGGRGQPALQPMAPLLEGEPGGRAFYKEGGEGTSHGGGDSSSALKVSITTLKARELPQMTSSMHAGRQPWTSSVVNPVWPFLWSGLGEADYKSKMMMNHPLIF